MATIRYDDARTRAPSLIRWGAVFAGAILALAAWLLLMSLWVAIASSSSGVADNLHWFAFGSALFSLLVGGFLAGWVSSTRGWGPGFLHGLTVWGLVLVGMLSAGIPSAARIFDAAGTPAQQGGSGPLWAGFLSLAIGLVTAVVGGLAGGAVTRPAAMFEQTAERTGDGARGVPERPPSGRVGV